MSCGERFEGLGCRSGFVDAERGHFEKCCLVIWSFFEPRSVAETESRRTVRCTCLWHVSFCRRTKRSSLCFVLFNVVFFFFFSLCFFLRNQLPDELARSFDDMVELLAPGAVMVITIKLSHLRPEQRQIRRFSKGSNRMVKYMLRTHPSLHFEGIKWLLQNKNERCVVFRKSK